MYWFFSKQVLEFFAKAKPWQKILTVVNVLNTHALVFQRDHYREPKIFWASGSGSASFSPLCSPFLLRPFGIIIEPILKYKLNPSCSSQSEVLFRMQY